VIGSDRGTTWTLSGSLGERVSCYEACPAEKLLCELAEPGVLVIDERRFRHWRVN
jgi:hypothetical protein